MTDSESSVTCMVFQVLVDHVPVEPLPSFAYCHGLRFMVSRRSNVANRKDWRDDLGKPPCAQRTW